MVLVKKEILPDKIILGNVNAQKFLLVNLSPDKWSDKKEYIDTTGYDKSVQLVKDIVNAIDDADDEE